ncbi:hypothetical protein PSY73_23725, partial [Shigella flexneri]|nr:hypothetical protein [Shigella flexneri]
AMFLVAIKGQVLNPLCIGINHLALARYDGECQMINANAERIKNLTFKGKPIDPNAMILVAIKGQVLNPLCIGINHLALA